MSAPLPVLLTVRGTLASSLDEVRKIHNETAGSVPGIANARSLGDLSHKVYAPREHASMSSAKAGELLFMDTWVAAEGIMKFFSDERVAQTSTLLFTEREPTIWMAAEGAFGFAQPGPMGTEGDYVGLIRGTVRDPVEAIQRFGDNAAKAMSAARRRGQLSHSVWVEMGPPGVEGPVRILGFERWWSLDGMLEHYADPDSTSGLGDVFTSRPDASLWEPAAGHWNEW